MTPDELEKTKAICELAEQFIDSVFFKLGNNTDQLKLSTEDLKSIEAERNKLLALEEKVEKNSDPTYTAKNARETIATYITNVMFYASKPRHVLSLGCDFTKDAVAVTGGYVNLYKLPQLSKQTRTFEFGINELMKEKYLPLIELLGEITADQSKILEAYVTREKYKRELTLLADFFDDLFKKDPEAIAKDQLALLRALTQDHGAAERALTVLVEDMLNDYVYLIHPSTNDTPNKYHTFIKQLTGLEENHLIRIMIENSQRELLKDLNRHIHTELTISEKSPINTPSNRSPKL